MYNHNKRLEFISMTFVKQKLILVESTPHTYKKKMVTSRMHKAYFPIVDSQSQKFSTVMLHLHVVSL
jgi:hypothetical protein